MSLMIYTFYNLLCTIQFSMIKGIFPNLCHSDCSDKNHSWLQTDEMGLGKTVELLACVLAHRWSASEAHCIESGDGSQANQDDQICIRRIKRERVECICGAVSESYRYEGLWVQCDICDAWQHSDCVGYSPRGRKIKKSGREEELVMSKVNSKSPRKKNGISFVEREGKYICQMCLELTRATESPVSSGATLIVCPAPILLQWHAEILRYNLCPLIICTPLGSHYF